MAKLKFRGAWEGWFWGQIMILDEIEKTFNETQWIMFSDKVFVSVDERIKYIETRLLMAPWDYNLDKASDVETFARLVLVLPVDSLKESSKVYKALMKQT